MRSTHCPAASHHSHDVNDSNVRLGSQPVWRFTRRTGVFLAALVCVGLFTAAFFYNRAQAATTYTWNQTGTASWALDTNWTPTRTTPAVDDILVFNNAATSIVTNVPTQTIGQLAVSGINTDVTLQPAAGVLTLTIGGAAGTDLSVAASSALNISGGTTNTNTLKILMAGGATAVIDGTMTFSTAQHQLDAVDASGITFSSGAIFSYNPGGLAGNAFTNAGTANAVVFASGSIYVFQGGANPFGLAQPASKVVFQSGSLFNQQGTGTPSFSGRTYANFTLNNAAANITVTGGAAVSINNLTITAGTLNFNMTGTPGHSIKGNISVASGATLNFNPATPGTVNFNGAPSQSISNSGTLTTAANQSFVIPSASSVTINNNFTLAGAMTVNSGGTLASGATYTNNGTTTVNGTFRLHSSGVAAGNAFTYGAGSTLHYFGTGSGPQTSTNIEWPAANGPANVTINNGQGVTLHAARTITGTLDLLNGIFATAGNLSMASGSQITKSAGDMTGTPQGVGTYNVVYSGFAKPSGSELDGAGLTNVTLDMVPSQFLSIGATKTVPGVLTLMNGLILTGGNTLIIGAAGSVVRTNGHVVGNFQKTFTAAGTRTFEVGTVFDYSPVDVNATAGTFPANFTVSATIGAMPGISGPNKLGRFWTLTNTTVSSANLTFNYLPGDVTGTVANYQFVRKTGGTLTVLPPSGTPTSTQATINGVTTFSDWTLAEPSSVTTVLVVNNIGDSGDATPGNGVCETATGNGICTLRAAVQEANATPFGTGIPIDINFSLPNSIITVNSELPLSHNININGPTAASIQISGSAAAPTRVFHTMPGRTVRISNLTVAFGRVIGAGLSGMGAGLLAEGPGSNTTLTGMLFAGNTAVDTSGLFGGGGAMTVNGGALTIINSTFSQNTGTVGGGIGFQGAGPLILVNATVTNNFANGDTGASGLCAVDGDGGGIGGPTMPAANISLRNSIVAGNTDCNGDEPNITAAGGFINQGNNLTSGDPLVGPLQNNGGPTWTHGLNFLSPAIDAGNDCVFDNTCSPAVGVALTTDQRGLARKADGDTVPGTHVDIGAFEKQIPSAAGGAISGQITDASGNSVAGVAVRLSGDQTRLTVTDAAGNYRFEEVGTGGFFTVTPKRTNYTFVPATRSFSQLGDQTVAGFTASTTAEVLNPLDTTEFFVRQQYVDFLGREPDEAGLNFWVNNIAACGTDLNCLAAKRTDTSAAFFLSIEFQQTGYLVYRFYQAAYGRIPGTPVPINFAELRFDNAIVGRGVVVNESDWEAKLEANKQAYAVEFVGRRRFMDAYPAVLAPEAFVDRLFSNAGVVPGGSDRGLAIAEFAGAHDSANAAARARALRRVAENASVRQQETNRAFVLMQYFGYLGRDPNSSPDTDYSGYLFWLNKLDSFNGDFRRADMVKAFLVAGEYRARFPR